MKTVRGRLTLGFEGGPLFGRWDKARRRVLENAATQSIRLTVGENVRIAWDAIPVAADAAGDLSESEVRRAISAALAGTVSDPKSRYITSLLDGGAARPVRVSREWTKRGLRRQHTYRLQRLRKTRRGAPQPWSIDDKNERARIVAFFSWES